MVILQRTWPIRSQFELLSTAAMLTLVLLIPLCPSPQRLMAGRVVTGTTERGNNKEIERKGEPRGPEVDPSKAQGAHTHTQETREGERERERWREREMERERDRQRQTESERESKTVRVAEWRTPNHSST